MHPQNQWVCSVALFENEGAIDRRDPHFVAVIFNPETTPSLIRDG